MSRHTWDMGVVRIMGYFTYRFCILQNESRFKFQGLSKYWLLNTQ